MSRISLTVLPRNKKRLKKRNHFKNFLLHSAAITLFLEFVSQVPIYIVESLKKM